MARHWSDKDGAYHECIQRDLDAGVADKDSEYWLSQDNLDAQKQEDYKKMNKELNQSLSWYSPPQLTDDTQPVDDGAGRDCKLKIGETMDDWLEVAENLEKWENGELSASDRRVLLTHWTAQAWTRVLAGDAKRKYFEHTGALLTIDGSEDHLLKFNGKPKDEPFVIPEPSLEGAPRQQEVFKVDEEPEDEPGHEEG